jgi:hypothetical protein
MPDSGTPSQAWSGHSNADAAGRPTIRQFSLTPSHDPPKMAPLGRGMTATWPCATSGTSLRPCLPTILSSGFDTLLLWHWEKKAVIIWGSTTKNNVVAQGEFYCPRCRAFTDYSRHAVRQYFTLYFIPLFPMGTLAEYIECQQCRGNFEPAICDLSAGQIEGLLKPWSCPGCQNMNPAAEAHCMRCQTVRPQEDARDLLPPSSDEPDQRAASEPLPRLDPPVQKKKARNSDYWRQFNEPGRCHECGVINPYRELHCKACGSELGVQ